MRRWLGAALLLAGCAQGGGIDAGDRPRDAGPRDAGRTRVDAGHDGGSTLPDAGSDGGGRVDAGHDAGGGVDAGGCGPGPANIEISEIMVSSQTGSGDLGEWFEIHNLSRCAIDLTGIQIQSGGTHTVASGLLTAGGFFVFAQSADAAANHMLRHDYVYGSGVRFSNSSGTLTLSAPGGAEIAHVSWGSTDHRTGASRQLGDGATMTPSIGASAWCDSTDVYSMSAGGPYLGTPAMLNRACP